MVKSGKNGKNVACGTGGRVRHRRSADNRFLRVGGIVIRRLARGEYVRPMGKKI